MCLIIFAYQVHPSYPLIVAANRDEFFSRATKQAHWWLDVDELLAGKDLVAGGTWLGVSANGRFSALTNVREPHLRQSLPRSRGELPRHYLKKGMTSRQFTNHLPPTSDQYPGYNLLYGDCNELYYFSNRAASGPKRLKPGIYGLSNAQLDTPWPKVTTAKEQLARLLDRSELSSEKLLSILSATDSVADDLLPSTGVSLEWERKLSAIRITGPEYGTRSSTVVQIDRYGNIDFHERTFCEQKTADVAIRFQTIK